MMSGANAGGADAESAAYKSRIRGDLIPPTPSAVPSSPLWTREENKLFERALVEISEEFPNRWQQIAELLPGKSPEEVEKHYIKLDRDVRDIESGLVDLPPYPDDYQDNSFVNLVNLDSQHQYSQPKSKSSDSERRKGTPWTKDEHEKFLVGLEKYGKGDWRSISRNVVCTRTPTQVASHAQKFFLRQQSGKKERKRSSIHDITKVDTEAVDARPMAMSMEQLWVSPQQQQQQQHLNHFQGPGGPPNVFVDYQMQNQNVYM